MLALEVCDSANSFSMGGGIGVRAWGAANVIVQ